MGCTIFIKWGNTQLEFFEGNINGIMITIIVRFLGHNSCQLLLGGLSQVRMIDET